MKSGIKFQLVNHIFHLKGRHTTVNEHKPKSHQQWAKRSPLRFINWAAKVGPHTAQLIELILNSRKHPQQGFCSCLGILRLAKKSYDNQRSTRLKDD
jgi:hypothetical protein